MYDLHKGVKYNEIYWAVKSQYPKLTGKKKKGFIQLKPQNTYLGELFMVTDCDQVQNHYH